MMADKRDAIRAGIKELEDYGYLVRYRYRKKDTKKYAGMVWVCSDYPETLDIQEVLDVLDGYGCEILPETTAINGSNRIVKANAGADNTNNNNVKNNKHKSSNKATLRATDKRDRKITVSMFEQFWSIYPNKTDKGKAKTKWQQICTRKTDRDSIPLWSQIEKAINEQKKTDRWSKHGYIPLPTTWLNQQRWLDDPAMMADFEDTPSMQKVSGDPRKIARRYLQSRDMTDIFMRKSHQPAMNLFRAHNRDLDEGVVATVLIKFCEQIKTVQDENIPKTSEFYQFSPHPLTVIEGYIEFLEEQSSWMDSLSLAVFDITSAIFSQYRSKLKRLDTYNRDPLTGR
ncbi:MAG: hypothetical protein PHI12_11770 [Dehalococcoidales bacterium]|nr:hypothetical protein [Dehalococcoidales bacterium]